MGVLRRKIFREVIWSKLLGLQWRWLARRAWALACLKSRRRTRAGLAPAPLMAVLLVTENCNGRCPMCDLPHRFRRNPVEIGTAVWKRAIDDLHKMGAAGVGFTGGECTLRKDIFELIGHARRHGLPVTLNTNALPLTDDRLDELVAADPTNINISIDSGRDDVNDHLRGGRDVLRRTLDRVSALEARRRSARAGYTLTVVTVLSEANVNDLEVLFQRVAASGADRIGFMPLHNAGDGQCGIANLGPAAVGLAGRLRELSAVYSLPIENSDAYISGLDAAMSGGQLPVPCNAAYTTLFLGADLRLYRCWPHLEMGRSFARWDGETPLGSMWNDEVFRQERLRSLPCRQCYWNCHAELSYLVRI